MRSVEYDYESELWIYIWVFYKDDESGFKIMIVRLDHEFMYRLIIIIIVILIIIIIISSD